MNIFPEKLTISLLSLVGVLYVFFFLSQVLYNFLSTFHTAHGESKHLKLCIVEHFNKVNESSPAKLTSIMSIPCIS